MNFTRIILYLMLLLPYMQSKAQVGSDIASNYWNFDQEVPSNWQGAGLQHSTKHFKIGTASIAWHWKQGEHIQIENPQGIQQAFKLEKPVSNSLYKERADKKATKMQKNGGLMCWIYNEKAIDDSLTITFGEGTQPAYQFHYYLDFTGWRACWIRFSEMTTLKQVKSLDYMTIQAPELTPKGTLYFDRMLFGNKPIHGRSTPDKQLPYINPKVNMNHWGGQWYWETHYQHDIALEPTITEKEKLALFQIELKTMDLIQGPVPHQDENWYYKDHFKDLCIHRAADGTITGRPIVSADEYNAKYNDLKPLQLSSIFYGLARGYALTNDDYCKEMFFDLFDHFVDQGYDYGSATGTQHHVGYQLEGLPESFLLMKEALRASGRLDKAAEILHYWYGNAECRRDISVNEIQGVSDFWNTKARGRLIAVLLMDDSPEKVREMKALTRFIDNSLQYSSGSVGGITPDGCLYHHAGLYPAYMTGSFMGIAPVVYSLSNTPFAIGKQALHNLSQSMLLMRNFSNKYEWGIAISGRQVFAGMICQRAIDGMGYVAKSSTPIDTLLASAYMRLANPWEKMYYEFQEKGIQPETKMDGFQVVNYACLGLHRRDDWLVTVKGYNRYVWSGEIYAHDNRWGRYMSYGSIQINNQGDPIDNKHSGYDQNGWDWNRFPGTTTIHLPLDKLYCPVRTLMSRSDETFCGTSSLGKNGIFGMKLHEKETLKNFTPDHRARKSVFLFDDCLIALGSDIQNSNKEYPTETTLFQLESKEENSITLDGQSYTDTFEIAPNPKKAHILYDNKGNTHFIAKGQDLVVYRKTQTSKHNKSERETHGTFSVAYLKHGKAPRHGSYEYATIVNGAKSGHTPDYTVLQKNRKAHIVEDHHTGITGLVLFEAGSVKNRWIKSINHEALVMIQEKSNKLNLSVCSPSVNFGSDRAYDNKPSVPVDITLVVAGQWKPASTTKGVKVLSQTKGRTTLQFHCVDGKTIKTELVK
ncbi:hypothetical protein K4L44_12235 [Halosquirtibacter laminarini]|uniref:Uncharacterized protein n=1 Tax=Halosquirtibacter laminarini TaxID=3374600 RepID=A0AC61NJ18_9BACT|nr:hypothetical protein K4L44_12235 [Prolixibacteraceae bacterium]